MANGRVHHEGYRMSVYYYLLLAIIWLLFAGVIFMLENVPGASIPRIPGTDWSMGWFALVLALYNIFKVYFHWGLERRQRNRKPTRGQVLPADGRGPRVDDDSKPAKQPEPDSPFAGLGDGTAEKK